MLHESRVWDSVNVRDAMGVQGWPTTMGIVVCGTTARLRPDRGQVNDYRPSPERGHLQYPEHSRQRIRRNSACS